MTNTFAHQSVLLAECMALLDPRPGYQLADVTAGGGGHSTALLEAIGAGGRLLCVDRDAVAVSHLKERFAEAADRVVVVQGSFSELPAIVSEYGLGKLNGVLADLGVSSPQLDHGLHARLLKRKAGGDRDATAFAHGELRHPV